MDRFSGVVAKGYGVASGIGNDKRFPLGTIAPQLPFFQNAIPGFSAYLECEPFPGTINIDFVGCTVALLQADFVVPNVKWTEHFAAESFWLTRSALVYGRQTYPAFFYVPDPATKPDHIQRPSIVEMVCAFIPGIIYGAAIDILCATGALRVERDHSTRGG